MVPARHALGGVSYSNPTRRGGGRERPNSLHACSGVLYSNQTRDGFAAVQTVDHHNALSNHLQTSPLEVCCRNGPYQTALRTYSHITDRRVAAPAKCCISGDIS